MVIALVFNPRCSYSTMNNEGCPTITFWDRCVGQLFVTKICFILELPVLMLLDFCFLCLKLRGEGKVSSLSFRVIPTVKSYYWHHWMLLISHKLLAVVRAISSVVLQDPSTPQKGVFLLSCILCHLPGTSAGAGLCLHHVVCSYLPNRQKSDFLLRKSLVPRIKHNLFSCCESVFFII